MASNDNAIEGLIAERAQLRARIKEIARLLKAKRMKRSRAKIEQLPTMDELFSNFEK